MIRMIISEAKFDTFFVLFENCDKICVRTELDLLLPNPNDLCDLGIMILYITLLN